MPKDGVSVKTTFQSTLSVRRATHASGFHDSIEAISIHALRKESDRPPEKPETPSGDFNPRSP